MGHVSQAGEAAPGVAGDGGFSRCKLISPQLKGCAGIGQLLYLRPHRPQRRAEPSRFNMAAPLAVHTRRGRSEVLGPVCLGGGALVSWEEEGGSGVARAPTKEQCSEACRGGKGGKEGSLCSEGAAGTETGTLTIAAKQTRWRRLPARILESRQESLSSLGHSRQ